MKNEIYHGIIGALVALFIMLLITGIVILKTCVFGDRNYLEVFESFLPLYPVAAMMGVYVGTADGDFER